MSQYQGNSVIPTGIIPTNVVGSAGNIVSGNSSLFLFMPRDIIDHVKRPLTYNFNEATTAAITEHIVNHPSGHHTVNKVLNTTPDISQAIIPSTMGIPLATSAYSGNWMFVLIVDEPTKRSMFSNNRLETRTILIGMCSQEPIGNRGIASATPESFLNPNCQLIVTRQLQLAKYPSSNGYGSKQRVETMADNNIVQYDHTVWGGATVGNRSIEDDQTFFTMLPGEVQHVTSIEDGAINSMLQHDEAINYKGPSIIRTDIESPRKHMKDILTAFESGVGNVAFSSAVGMFDTGINQISDTDDNLASFVHSALDEHSMLNNTCSNLTIPNVTTMHLTLGIVMQTYSPRVNIIATPKHSNAEIIPQGYLSINTVFSSLVCAVLPTYLNNVGLSAVSFMYNSYHDAYQVLHIESAVQSTDVELQFKWRAFVQLIKFELFPVLLGAGGQFDLQAMASINSTTDVILNFNDFEPLPNGTIFQENTVLGGIVSPLIGTGEHLKQNSVQLNSLIDNVKDRCYLN